MTNNTDLPQSIFPLGNYQIFLEHFKILQIDVAPVLQHLPPMSLCGVGFIRHHKPEILSLPIRPDKKPSLMMFYIKFMILFPALEYPEFSKGIIRIQYPDLC